MTDVAPAAPPWAGDAAAATLCNFGTTGATYAAAAAWGSAYTGQVWGVVGFGAASAALAAASAANGCYTPPPPEPAPPGSKVCCELWSNSTADVYWFDDAGNRNGAGGWPTNVQRLVQVKYRPDLGEPDNKPDGYAYYEVITDRYDSGNFVTTIATAPLVWNESGCWSLDSGNGSCAGTAPEPEPGLPDPPEPIPTPDPETGCNWSTSMETAYLNAAGNMVIQYKATADDPEQCGGPIYWWEEPGKPPVVVQPDPTDPDKPVPPPEPLPEPCPDPCPPAPDPCPEIPEPLQLPEKVYKLSGVCETMPNGLPQPEYEYPIAAGRFEEVLSQKLDVIATMLQQHLALKTPICPPERPQLKGDYRTISFISDEKSPYGNDRLRKRLRYRSESSIELGGLVDHWADFTWTAGPVCVWHSGSPVGTPQVWAASADEGKRVIRHAFREAGVDPDQVGEWSVSGSDNPRYGVSGTMRVCTKGGYYWITERLGSNSRPLVARV